MAYNSMISRTDAAALIPEDVSAEILKAVPAQSAVMQLGKRLRNMTRGQQRMPVLSALPTAYFVAGDTGLKQTTKVEWENVYINAEEIACIVPIPESVLADAEYDIWAEVKPLIAEAFGVVIDAAVLHGVNKPASWPVAIIPGATAAEHVVTAGSGDDSYSELLGEGGVISLVEEDGYMVTGHVGHMTVRAKLRGIRDNDKQPIFVRSMQDRTRYELDGAPIQFPANGAVDGDEALLVSGDWGQLVYAMRQDITYKMLTEAVIQDNTGATVYNLAQQDMVALRCVMRMGWQLPKPISRMNQDAATRYPFAVWAPAQNPD